MFDRKLMKIIGFERAKQELLNGTQVFMVQLDGSLVEFTEATDWRILFFHNLKQGSYAIYRRKFTDIQEFQKEVHIGRRTFKVEHTKEGGGASWKFVSCREEV